MGKEGRRQRVGTTNKMLISNIVTVKFSRSAKSLQLCLTLCDLIEAAQPGSPVPGILQARTLEWVSISFSRLRD